jgi:hypothetical protein
MERRERRKGQYHDCEGNPSVVLPRLGSKPLVSRAGAIFEPHQTVNGLWLETAQERLKPIQAM